MKTLATCMDLLAQGETHRVGDILMQRFKAVETALDSKSWDVAKHHELVEQDRASAVSQEEREVTARLALREHQLEKALHKPRKEAVR